MGTKGKPTAKELVVGGKRSQMRVHSGSDLRESTVVTKNGSFQGYIGLLNRGWRGGGIMTPQLGFTKRIRGKKGALFRCRKLDMRTLRTDTSP